ncbi:hypothetical protein [Rhodanobacter sp. C01]|uniref:hypothetical protein n=1 Tax=Rhodanobacter sp. C01 TaxID=1945856 RepID=UPI0009C4793D|nr:hypothetical protein [Rhodanobacter sp. C01]OOG51257.1 hypothetical protein B0E50_00585 [Rhodanobacter sp. C01]
MSIPHKFTEVDKDASRLMIFGQSLETAAVNGKHKKDADFAEAYPTMEQHLARKVPQKVVLEKFNTAYGHTLHPLGFRKMLDEERKRRDGCGEVVACSACGQPLLRAIKVAEDGTDAEEQNHVQ